MTDHVAHCVDCRKAELAYREAGERLRQLPSITPPPNFRESVFAAIRADQERISPEIARAAAAVTNPALPVIRPVPIARKRRVVINPRAALAVAAVLLLALFAANIVPGLSALDHSAASLSPLSLQRGTRAHVTSYALPSGFSAATSAVATTGWLVYSAVKSGGTYMLLAENRATKRATPLTSESRAALTVHAVTNRWVIWSTGDPTANGSWMLQASQLPTADGAAPATQTLLSPSNDSEAPASVAGIWADDEAVLVAGMSVSGTGALWRIPLNAQAGVAAILARSAQSGHLFTSPSRDGATYYWADVWYDAPTGLHSALAESNAAGYAPVESLPLAFHPEAGSGKLVWVDVAPQALSHAAPAEGSTPAAADQLLLNQLNGGLQARDLATGSQWQVSDRADVTSVQRGGSLVLWKSDAHTHVYDLRAKAPAAVESQLRDATLVTLSPSAITWENGASSQVYVADLG